MRAPQLLLRFAFRTDYLRISRVLPRHLGLRPFENGNWQTLRLQHEAKSLEGPGLKDFIVKEVSRNENSLESEDIPYVEKTDLNGQGQKVYFEVYGCQMNVSDIEIVWSILKEHGYEKTSNLTEADIVLMITCALRESSETKIWTKLNDLRSFKIIYKKKNMKVGVLGCMAERLKGKLLETKKLVDLVAGPDSYKDLPRLLAITRTGQKALNVMLSLDETYADVMPVRLDDNQVTAFISIMRGCDNMCSYCIVPFTRGKERSRPLTSILGETRMLSDEGIKQVTLLGQNVNSYRDLSAGNETEVTKLSPGFKTVYKTKKGGVRFDVLLDEISKVDPNMRIRFTAPHPKDFPDEVLYLIRDRKNICCNLHLPAQSGSNTVLERMRRGYTREAYCDLVCHIRSILPEVSFSTDIITGFCGETEEDHQATLDLLKTVRYNFVYFYPYSMREKTTAHRRYTDDVPKEVKIRRLTEIELVFRNICKELNEAQINQTQLVLIDGYSKKSKEYLQGRNDGNIKVIIPCGYVAASESSSETKPLRPGDYVAVKITEGNSQVLKGLPLYHTTLVDFNESLEGKLVDKISS